MAEGHPQVEEHQHQHVLIVTSSDIEVLYRALVHRWLAIEDYVATHDIDADDAAPHLGDYDACRALCAQLALKIVDEREDCPPCTLG